MAINYSSKDHWNEQVYLRRTFRASEGIKPVITRQRDPRWLAEIIIGAIPRFEPNVASAIIEPIPRIVVDPHKPYLGRKGATPLTPFIKKFPPVV